MALSKRQKIETNLKKPIPLITFLTLGGGKVGIGPSAEFWYFLNYLEVIELMKVSKELHSIASPKVEECAYAELVFNHSIQSATFVVTQMTININNIMISVPASYQELRFPTKPQVFKLFRDYDSGNTESKNRMESAVEKMKTPMHTFLEKELLTITMNDSQPSPILKKLLNSKWLKKWLGESFIHLVQKVQLNLQIYFFGLLNFLTSSKEGSVVALVQAGIVDVNLADPVTQLPPLHRVDNSITVIKALLAAKANPSIQDRNGLIYLMKVSHPDAAKVLMAADVKSIDAVDVYGWTPMMHAICYERESVMKVLLESKADINRKYLVTHLPLPGVFSNDNFEEHSALSFAVKLNRLRVLPLLLENKIEDTTLIHALVTSIKEDDASPETTKMLLSKINCGDYSQIKIEDIGLFRFIRLYGSPNKQALIPQEQQRVSLRIKSV